MDQSCMTEIRMSLPVCHYDRLTYNILQCQIYYGNKARKAGGEM